MKILVAISILLCSTIAVITVLEAFDIIEVQTSILDFQDNGNSEKDTSENSEDDAEKNTFSAEDKALHDPKLGLISNNILALTSAHFKDVPVPPPDR